MYNFPDRVKYFSQTFDDWKIDYISANKFEEKKFKNLKFKLNLCTTFTHSSKHQKWGKKKIRQMYKQTNRQRHKQTKMQTGKDTNRQSHKQTKAQTDKDITHIIKKKERGEKMGKNVWKKTQS